SDVIKHILRFMALVAVQVLVLNQVQFTGTVNPYLYVYFLLVMPVGLSPNLGLLVGFLLGFTVDIFTQTLGMHTIATTFLAYCRPYVLRYMASRDGFEFVSEPSVHNMGAGWFVTYASIMVLLHHFVLFFIEIFRINGLFYTLWKSIASSLFTLVLIMLTQYL